MKQNWKRIALIAGIALVAAAGIVALVIFVGIPAAGYGKASSLEKKGDLPGAYDAYDRMEDYRNAQDAKEKLQDEVIATRSAKTMSFGGYEWLILEERDGKVLLLMEEVLEMRAYHATLAETDWENCTLRQWLNGSFYNSLPEADRARVVETAVVNSNNAEYGTKAGNDTKDRVFLLSLAEANLYFKNNDARVACLGNSAKYWWLRSPGMDPIVAAIVTSDGSLGFAGSGVSYNTRGVRPAMWITKG